MLSCFRSRGSIFALVAFPHACHISSGCGLWAHADNIIASSAWGGTLTHPLLSIMGRARDSLFSVRCPLILIFTNVGDVFFIYMTIPYGHFLGALILHVYQWLLVFYNNDYPCSSMWGMYYTQVYVVSHDHITHYLIV